MLFTLVVRKFLPTYVQGTSAFEFSPTVIKGKRTRSKTFLDTSPKDLQIAQS